MNRRQLEWIVCVMMIVVALIVIALALTSCVRIPVEVHPAFTDAAKPEPIPLPVAQLPETIHPPAEDGTQRVIPDDAPTPPPPTKFDWGTILGILGIGAGALGGGWGLLAQRGIGLLRTALVSAVEYGNAAEAADPADKAGLAALKAAHAKRQSRDGVLPLIEQALREAKR